MKNYGEHGREFISAELALRVLGALCNAGRAVALLEARGLPAGAIAAAMRGTVFKASEGGGMRFESVLFDTSHRNPN